MRSPAGLPQRLLNLDRCLVMGIVNVTPDSFSDGGWWLEPALAVDHGLVLAAEGADLVDVGGESTRPGAQRVSAGEEQRRILPVIEELTGAGVAVSVDTMRAETAVAAVMAGAVLVNDVSGGRADPEMYEALAGLQVPYVVMHWRAHSQRMGNFAAYGTDVFADVLAELDECVERAVAAGVAPDRLVLDPGLGFAKEAAHNWALLAELNRLVARGHPVLVGASRKRFLGELLRDESGPRPVHEREAATAAVSTLCAAAGVWCVRVHSVRDTRDAIEVVRAWQHPSGQREPGP